MKRNSAYIVQFKIIIKPRTEDACYFYVMRKNGTDVKKSSYKNKYLM